MTNLLTRKMQTSILVLLAIFFIMTSCDKSVSTGDVEGIVFFKGTNIPVAGVKVDVDGITAISSEEGSYRIEGIATGKQTLTAEKQGFLPFSTEITIQEGAITVLIPIISPAFTSVVRGVITGDFTGNPQPGLTVVMLNPDGSESGIMGTTDEEGNYQLQDVPFGDRILVVKSSGSLVFQGNIIISTPDYSMDITIPEPMVFTDARDGKSYSARKIGDQIWMEENLAYLPQVCQPDWESDSLELYYVYGYQGSDLNEATGSTNYST